ncbi:MAG: hypothetical protein KBD21_02860 [Candidatus Pacebacteria bacterium]|nr:hypothetical protein [Candidatus Paceibacterota bacterium]
MERNELARQNHFFLVVQVPQCMFGDCFQDALWDAYILMQEIREDGRFPGPNDFCHCGFETGYVGISAPAAESIENRKIDTFALASALYMAFSPGADTGELNDRVTVTIDEQTFVFTITDYETDDPEHGWTNVTAHPLSVPSGQTMHRRVIISTP